MQHKYNGLVFRTALEAQWAAFFDLVGWKWNVNPVSLNDWSPDFRVTFPCDHSECGPFHTLLVAVLPISRVEDFKGHPCLDYNYHIPQYYETTHIHIDAGAAFGNSPSVTTWQFSHGAGGGVYSVDFFVPRAFNYWSKAKEIISQ